MEVQEAIKHINHKQGRVPTGFASTYASRLWRNILSWQFSTERLYSNKHSTRDVAGYLTYVTSRYRTQVEIPFLMVVFKEGSNRDYTSEWDAGKKQLRAKLLTASFQKFMKEGLLTRMYGIVAIGKFLKIFTYSHVNEDIKYWHPEGEALLTSPKEVPLNMEGDFKMIQGKLNGMWLDTQHY
jgi:hypothetical protein